MLKRPILIILLGYIIGIIIGLYCKISIAFFIIIALLSHIIMKKDTPKTKKIKEYFKVFYLKQAIIILVTSMIIANVITIKQSYSYENKYKDISEMECIATVESSPKIRKYYTQYKVKVESINKDKKYKNTYVYLNLKKIGRAHV